MITSHTVLAFAARCVSLLGLASIILVVASGCVSHRAIDHATVAFDADGIFVRHLRLRLAPSHTQAFETLMKRCVEAADASDSADPFDWLCYREPPGRYWIILFSVTENGFDTAAGLPGFAIGLGRAESTDALREIQRMLNDLEYETEWEIVSRQKASWSTVASMSTATHPKARLMDRLIRPGMEEAFEAALAARTAFLAEHGYPLPIEGFVVRSGAPGRAWQAVFPVDWSSFHATDSFFAFVRSLDEDAQEHYADLKSTLMETMSGAEYYDADFALELSYSAP